jgi:glycosyltransferase involved in cell wall biosynthesis
LIEAAPAILRTQPQTQFYFVGALENPPYEGELKALLASQGLLDRFHFTGWRNDVPRVIRAMDVVVVATVTPEPAALMLMEAMAMERPIVATRTGGTPEIVLDGETGLLFKPGDARQLADCVSRVLADNQLARGLGTRAKRRVEARFDRERQMNIMVELYERASSRTPQ